MAGTDLDMLASLGATMQDTQAQFDAMSGAADIAYLEDISIGSELDATDTELVLSTIEKKALALLGSGCNNETVASALGVTPSTITGMLAQKFFRDKVTELRFKSLQKHTARDNAYDNIEDILLTKLKNSLPLMVAPKTIMEAIKVVNGAKRRGASNPQNIATQAQVTQLILPAAIIQNFTVNSNNQVIQAGNQTLVTMESRNLDKLVEAKRTEQLAIQLGGNQNDISEAGD